MNQIGICPHIGIFFLIIGHMYFSFILRSSYSMWVVFLLLSRNHNLWVLSLIFFFFMIFMILEWDCFSHMKIFRRDSFFFKGICLSLLGFSIDLFYIFTISQYCLLVDWNIIIILNWTISNIWIISINIFGKLTLFDKV